MMTMCYNAEDAPGRGPCPSPPSMKLRASLLTATIESRVVHRQTAHLLQHGGRQAGAGHKNVSA